MHNLQSPEKEKKKGFGVKGVGRPAKKWPNYEMKRNNFY